MEYIVKMLIRCSSAIALLARILMSKDLLSPEEARQIIEELQNKEE